MNNFDLKQFLVLWVGGAIIGIGSGVLIIKFFM